MYHDRAFVLMTAMPPTKGHAALIDYARHIADHVVVILSTQPDEPFIQERYDALRAFTRMMGRVELHHHKLPMQQEPSGPDDRAFWDLWRLILDNAGATTGDAVVASERYGAPTAELFGGTFYPFDMDRILVSAKATNVRKDPIGQFVNILPQFQPYLRKTVTIFGAESTGKTTLARMLDPRYTPEWARPYLEVPEVGNEITAFKMHAIWTGQRALQDFVKASDVSEGKPFLIQDTDLFSTLGYWRLNEATLGPVPKMLPVDAARRASDLYVITRSNIPFEKDPLRYGGDVREATDEWWIALAEEFDLNYVVLDADRRDVRHYEARQHLRALYGKTKELLSYQREGKEYE